MNNIHPIQLPLPLDGKVCTKCKIWKPLDAFYKAPKAKRERPDCRSCHYKAESAYRARTKERWKTYRQEYYRTHREEMKAQTAAWLSRHHDEFLAYARQYRIDNAAKEKARSKAYHLSHQDKSVVRKHRRRSLIRKAGGTFTAQEWRELKAKYDHRCLKCGAAEPDITLSLDHVIPIAKGGANDITNIQPLCLPCNLHKHTAIADYRP